MSFNQGVIIGVIGALLFFSAIGVWTPFGKQTSFSYEQLTLAIDHCQQTDSDLNKTSTELAKLKSTDLYLENKQLKETVYVENNNRLAFYSIVTLLFIGFCLAAYFFINKYQANKIEELKNKMNDFKIKKEWGYENETTTIKKSRRTRHRNKRN